jgi:tetratricopeptide (TPR) repeat protein
MLTPEAPSDGKSLAVKPQPIRLVLFEDGLSPLSMVLPPYEDMAEIASFKDGNYSISDLMAGTSEHDVLAMNRERARLERKREIFSSSPTFWNRLANIASVASDGDAEASYLDHAVRLSPDEFFMNRIGENLVARERLSEAEKFFQKLDLDTNLHANLRLAAFFAAKKDIASASARVAQALKIDPLDFNARLFDGALKLFIGEHASAILSFKVAAEQRYNSASLYTNMAIAYLRLNRTDKALQSLRKAVAVDPLSANAVSLLADVAYAEKRSEDAIPSLRYFIRFEQKNSPMWSRLARALISIDEYNEAIAALKRQGSVEDTSDVWNNLGVAYYFKNDSRKALESFKRAMELSGAKRDYAFCIAARNAAGVMSKQRPVKEVLDFISYAIVRENEHLVVSHPELSQLFVLQLNALVKSKRVVDAAKLGEDLLRRPDCDETLRGWVAVGLLTHYALNREYADRALSLAKEWAERISAMPKGQLRLQLINNIAFVHAEAGELAQADRYLQMISESIHKEPYPTATLGLLHLRRNHSERASALYQEAIHLATATDDKSRIRQKWNLELARMILNSDPRRATKLLEKVVEEKNGEDALTLQGAELLKSLSAK